MSKLDNFELVSQEQLKQVMLSNSDKADKRYVKKTDVLNFVTDDELGSLAKKNAVGTDDLDSALAGTINGKANSADLGPIATKSAIGSEDLDSELSGVINGKANATDVYTKIEVDESIDSALDNLGDLANLDVVAENDLAEGLKSKINNTYTKAEVYTKEETYNKTEVDSAIAGAVTRVYKPAGTMFSTTLPEPTADILGYVFNMGDSFVADSKFVEEGQTINAGDNVVVIEDNGTFKYDKFAGSIDLSDYVSFDDINLATSKQINNIIDSLYVGMDTSDDPEEVDVVLASTTSLGEISAFFKQEGVTTVNAKLNDNIVVPPRSDGKISTIMINEGQTLNLDLNGNNIECVAYALVNNGGTVTLSDPTGEGTITTNLANKAYPAIENRAGTVIIDGVNIDTTSKFDGEGSNWVYSIVNSGSATVEVRSGHIKTDEASCLGITNGTASGAGATFVVGGDAVLESAKSSAIYLADNKNVIIKDNAVIKGGIIARMGDITIENNAQVINDVVESIDDFGVFLVSSGAIQITDGVLIMGGCYKTNTESNECNLTLKDNAKISTVAGDAVKICRLDNKYDQNINVTIEDSSNITVPEGYEVYRVLDHDALAEIAAASGKTLGEKSVNTNVIVTVDGEVVFNDVN